VNGQGRKRPERGYPGLTRGGMISRPRSRNSSALQFI